MKINNIQIKPINLVLVSVFVLIAILYGHAQAQQQSRWEDQQSQTQMTERQGQAQMTERQGRQMESQQRPDQARRQGASEQRQQQTVNLWRLDPKGIVNLGYDYNNDGAFDAFETITVYDLQKMQAQRSGQRAAEQQASGQETAQARKMQQDQVKGRLISTNEVEIANSGKTHLVAKVETEKGVANIDLGPQDDLSSLNLQKGQQIQVSGIQGEINDNFMLLANRLQVGDKRVKIDRSETNPLHRLNAKVLNTRTLSRGEHNMLMARVELQNGTKTLVNLGPQQQLPKISQGQQLQILARLTEIDGKKALIADRLRTKGQTFRIDWDQIQEAS